MSGHSRRQILRAGVALAGFGLLSGCGLVQMPGRQPAGPRRIGYLEAGTNPPHIETFRASMRDLGYVDGQHLAIEFRDAEGNLERLPALAAELVNLQVEVIVGSNNPAFIAASRATSTIPIVTSGGDVVAPGLVTNLARPGGNITGVSTNAVATYGKWIELLKEIVPGLARLAVVVDFSGGRLTWVEPAAEALRLQLLPYDLRDLDDLPKVLSTARADGADAVVVVSGGVLGGGGNPRIAAEVLKARLPAAAESRLFAVNGGLLALGANTELFARRAATYVDKILKGSRPGDLPIEQPTAFDLVVNLKTAQTLGLTIPPSVLQQATEVIQ